MNGQYWKLIAFDVAMAVLIVVLYSPGLLALSPADPGILRPGLAIVMAIFIAAALVWENVSVLRGRPNKVRQLDVSKPNAFAVANALERYSRADVVGQAASEGAAEIEAVQRKRDSLESIIESKFPKGSLTYGKFFSVVESATSTILKNCTMLANRIQAFDSVEYRELETKIRSEGYRSDNIPDEIQEEKWALYSKMTNDIDAIIAANEKLLLELDKYAVEIGQMDSGTAESESSAIIQEVKELIEQTKYYE